MTKNILLTEIKRKDMGLSVKKLLDDYFRADREKCQLFIKAEKTLSIFERVDEDQENRLEEQSKEIADLKDKVNSLVTLYELSKASSVV